MGHRRGLQGCAGTMVDVIVEVVWGIEGEKAHTVSFRYLHPSSHL